MRGESGDLVDKGDRGWLRGKDSSIELERINRLSLFLQIDFVRRLGEGDIRTGRWISLSSLGKRS